MQNFLRVVTGAGLAFCVAASVWGQPAASYAFDVASVKLAPPPTGNSIRFGMSGGPGSSSPGQITVENMALRDLVIKAYGLKPFQLTAPDWMTGTRYNIVAKVPANSTPEQVSMMWQTLLAERFHLTVHRENKELPVYALVPAKGGPKVVEADPETPKGPAGSSSGGGPVSFSTTSSGGGSSSPVAVTMSSVSGTPMRSSMGAGTNRYNGDHLTMSSLCDYLSRNADRPVIDATGLTGKYKVKLEWQREELSASASEGTPGPTLAVALQEQLGLRMEPRKAPVELLVVDTAEKTPTEN